MAGRGPQRDPPAVASPGPGPWIAAARSDFTSATRGPLTRPTRRDDRGKAVDKPCEMVVRMQEVVDKLLGRRKVRPVL